MNALTFQRKMADLMASMPLREGSLPEADLRNRTYWRILNNAALLDSDFIEACDRILFDDQWFPTIARIIEVTDECAKERRIRERTTPQAGPKAPLVCATCHGARWIRLGGYDPGGLHVGKDGRVMHDQASRMQHCPRCTTDGQYDRAKERGNILIEGGVPDPSFPIEPDMAHVTWPARMAKLRDPDTGRLDMDALYRLSRELRGLDPNVDERIKPVAGWKTVAAVVRELDEVA